MNDKEKEALKAAGWVFGDAEDFLGLNPEERREVDAAMEDCRQNGGISWDELKAKIEVHESSGNVFEEVIRDMSAIINDPEATETDRQMARSTIAEVIPVLKTRHLPYVGD